MKSPEASDWKSKQASCFISFFTLSDAPTMYSADFFLLIHNSLHSWENKLLIYLALDSTRFSKWENWLKSLPLLHLHVCCVKSIEELTTMNWNYLESGFAVETVSQATKDGQRSILWFMREEHAVKTTSETSRFPLTPAKWLQNFSKLPIIEKLF